MCNGIRIALGTFYANTNIHGRVSGAKKAMYIEFDT